MTATTTPPTTPPTTRAARRRDAQADAALDQMYGHYTRDDSARAVISELDALRAA